MLPFTIVSKKRLSELGSLQTELHDIRNEANNAVQFIEKIANGDLDVNEADMFGAHQHQTNLAQALVGMRNQMRSLATKERERQWASNGLAHFVDILRKQGDNAEQFYDAVISNLVKYVGANQGGLFVVETDETGENCIQLAACYAYNRKKYLQKRIAIGEGLLGQAYWEAQSIHLKQVPQGYVSITSGLGDAAPSSLLIVPLKINEKVFGLVELASFHEFLPYQIEFIEKLGENIASSIANVQVNHHTRHLLEMSQNQTEQLRAAEEEMRQNVEELQATQEEMRRKEVEMLGLFTAINLTLATVEFNLEGMITSANQNFLLLTGYTLDELKGRHHRTLVNPEYAQSNAYRDFWDKLRNGLPQTDDFMRLTKSGQPVWMRATYTPMTDPQGQVYKVIKMAMDITERKKAEIEFQKLSLVADNTDNSVVITDRHGFTEFVNKGFERLTGYTQAEVLGKKPGDLLQGPDTDRATVQRISQKLREGKPFQEEILNYNKKGQSYWISLAINPVLDEKGQVGKFISIQTDVTDTKLRALEFEAQLEAVNKSSGIVEFDTQGYVQTANALFLAAMGYTLPEIVGRHHSLFVTEGERQTDDYRQMWASLAHGEAMSGEYKRVDKNGNIAWLRGSYTPVLDLKGKAYKVIKVAQDITQQKMLQIEAQQQAEEIKTQEEELRQNMEELMSIQEAMARKQEEVQQTAQKYESILEGCADSVIMIDQIGTIAFFNRTAEKLWGYEREEVIGQNVRMLMGTEHATQHDRYLHNYNTTHHAKVIGIGREVEARRKNGSMVPILLTLSEAKLANGESVYTAFIKDITDRKAMELQAQQQMEELRTQEEELRQNMEELMSIQEAMARKQNEIEQTAQKYQNILEGCADSVIMINQTGTISFFNRTAEKLWGYDREEVIGQNVRMLMGADHAPQHDRYLNNYNTTRHAKVIGIGREVEARRKDGSMVPILLTLSEAKLENGESVYTAFIKDITERKALEMQAHQQMEELRTQEEELRQNMEELMSIQEAMVRKQNEVEQTAQKYEHILEGCADSVIMINQTGTVAFFNRTAEKLWGYEREEVIGQNVRMLMGADHAPQHDRYLNNYNTTRHAKVIGIGREVEARRKDGSMVPILLTLSEAKLENGESVYTAFIKDITERKALELQAHQQMEELRTQEEELRQNMEELQANQEEVARQSMELSALVATIDTTLATIEFEMDGSVLRANDNFLNTMGYRLDEILGKPHRLFVSPQEARSAEYADFWDKLRLGRPYVGEVKRITKDGRELWFSASYMPVLDAHKKPVKVIKIAQDITAAKQFNLDVSSQLKAIGKSHAVLELDMEGRILTANENLLEMLGYGINEILGRHHKLLVSKAEAKSDEYARLWETLKNGEIVNGEFNLLSKNHHAVKVKCSYSPIVDLNGKPYKIVAYAQAVH